MKTTYTILLFALLISLVGCEEKASSKDSTPIENTTEFLTQTNLYTQKNKQNHNKKKLPKTKINTQTINTITLVGTKGITHKFSLEKNTLSMYTQDLPLVLLNICSDTSPACIAQLSSFSRLQKKYKKNLFIISIWTKETDTHKTDILSRQKKENYFISYDSNSTDNHTLVSKVLDSLQINKNTNLPLNIIYNKGIYHSHFEGATPIEMITHAIQTSHIK